MAGLLDFFSPEAGQRRTAALGGLVDRAEYYVPPELRSILGFAGEMSPVAGLQRAGQASERMLDPSRTGGQRFGDLGAMLSETAGVAAPMAVAGRAGVPVAKAIQEGLLGFSAGADDVGRRVLDRLNQPGSVPTMYSNPLGGAKQKTSAAYHGETGSVTPARQFANMTRDTFLGNPRITGPSNAASLKPTVLRGLEDAEKIDFPVGKLTARYDDSGAAVYDGDKVVASYNFGDTLVVNPKYRKKGIGEELVYQWRTRFPAPAATKTRTKVSQRIQENVWNRIQRELAQGVGGMGLMGMSYPQKEQY